MYTYMHLHLRSVPIVIYTVWSTWVTREENGFNDDKRMEYVIFERNHRVVVVRADFASPSLYLCLFFPSVYFLEYPLSRLIFFPILFPLLRRNNSRGYQWLLIYRHRSLDGDIRLHTVSTNQSCPRIFRAIKFYIMKLLFFYKENSLEQIQH